MFRFPVAEECVLWLHLHALINDPERNATVDLEG